MTAVQQTRANLDFIKRRLRASLPHVRSSHLSEGLAAAFGHRTHASLLAHVAGPYISPVILADRQGFERRMTELGYCDVSWDGLAAVFASLEMPDLLWGTGSPKDGTAHAAWFIKCRKVGIPFLYIARCQAYADVDWDCITLDAGQDRAIRQDAGGAIVKTMFETFKRVAGGTGHSFFHGSAFVGSIKRIDPLSAQMLAQCYFSVLFRLSGEPRREGPRPPGSSTIETSRTRGDLPS